MTAPRLSFLVCKEDRVDRTPPQGPYGLKERVH